MFITQALHIQHSVLEVFALTHGRLDPILEQLNCQVFHQQPGNAISFIIRNPKLPTLQDQMNQ